MSWFPLYILALVILRCAATPRDRTALTILLVAAVGSTLVMRLVFADIHAAWKLAVPGAVEVLTILALWRWAKGLSSYLQIGCLCVSWIAHFLCFLDLCLNTNVVYDNYEAVLAGVAVAQLLCFYDSAFSIGRHLDLWAGRLAGFCATGFRPPVLRHSGSKGVPKAF